MPFPFASGDPARFHEEYVRALTQGVSVDRGAMHRWLGLHDAVDSDRVLMGVRCGVHEAGLLQSPLYADAIELAIGGIAPFSFDISLVVPDKRAWRLAVVTGWLEDGAGNPVLLIGAPSIHIIPGTALPAVDTGAIGGGASRVALGATAVDVPAFLGDVPGAESCLTAQTDVVLYPGDGVHFRGEGTAATDTAHLTIAYQSAPWPARPPF